MRKFRDFDDGIDELQDIDTELSLALESDDLEQCLDKLAVRSVIISQINQLIKNQEKMQESWASGQLIVDKIQKKKKNIEERLNKHKKFTAKIRHCNYDNFK
jgi:predicted XRE-type DNA-binding protein